MGLNRETATRLITKWGIPAVIQTRGELQSDGGGGGSYPLMAEWACVAFEANRQVQEQMTGGALYGVTDQAFVVAAEGLAIEPTTNDFLRVHGLTFAIEDKQTFRVRGEVGFYVLRVARHDP